METLEHLVAAALFTVCPVRGDDCHRTLRLASGACPRSRKDNRRKSTDSLFAAMHTAFHATEAAAGETRGPTDTFPFECDDTVKIGFKLQRPHGALDKCRLEACMLAKRVLGLR